MPASNSRFCGTLIQQGTLGIKTLLSGGELLSALDIEKLSDNELIALTLSGQKRAFEGIVRRYQKLVYNVAFQIVQNHEVAADLTQDTFLKAYKSLGTFENTLKLKPWLLKITSNTALNQIRDSRSKYLDSLEELLEESPQSEPASSKCLEEEIELRFSHAKLMEALQKLSARYRQIFILRYQHDLPYADIASITEETESTIKSLLFRIREKLRKMILAEETVK